MKRLVQEINERWTYKGIGSDRCTKKCHQCGTIVKPLGTYIWAMFGGIGITGGLPAGEGAGVDMVN